MIRLRARDGTVLTLPPEAMYVEICSEDGGVAAVLYNDGEEGLAAISKSSPAAARYALAYPVAFVPIQQVDAQRLIESMRI
jgi:hypothetical protein